MNLGDEMKVMEEMTKLKMSEEKPLDLTYKPTNLGRKKTMYDF